jgi:putative SOS response-associated peptidase YedK
MCGRFTLAIDIEDLLDEFVFELDEYVYKPRYNVAPTQQVLTYGAQGPGTAESMRWGLVPVWAKDIKIGFKMINARAETVATSGAFRTPLRRRRCLVLADGFYEWKKEGATKTPIRIGLKEWRPFGFAGVWDEWHGPDGPIRSCTIITTEPNELVEPIHNRMPVILPKETHATWLNQSIQDPEQLTPLLKPYPAEGMEAYVVSTAVNSSRNEDPECILPV